MCQTKWLVLGDVTHIDTKLRTISNRCFHLLGGSTDQMISYFVADNMGRSLNWGLASALAAILLAAVLVLYAIYDRIAGPGNLKLG